MREIHKFTSSTSSKLEHDHENYRFHWGKNSQDGSANPGHCNAEALQTPNAW